MQETRGPTAVNDGTFTADGTYSGTGVTYRVSGPPCDRADRAVTLDGSSGFVYTSIRVSNPSPFSTQLWFRTTTARGGYLVGFGNGTNGDTSSSRDRLVYMTNDGRVTFGVYDGSARTISSSRAYNDGAWHMVTATFSGSTGATLYVDGVQVAVNSAMTTAEPVSGLFRAGYDNLAGWPNAPTSNFFAGSIAHMGVFVTALPAGEVARQYAAFR
nr:LamG domain-containing protein [Modestobacter muralis]